MIVNSTFYIALRMERAAEEEYRLELSTLYELPRN